MTLEEITAHLAVLHTQLAPISAKVDAGQDLTPDETAQWHNYGWLIGEKWRLEDEAPRQHE